MKIFVCIKRVPNVAEAEIKLGAGNSLDLGGLAMEINETDNCAVEAALLLKEALGGSVHTVTIGPRDEEVMIRMALAKGCESAIRVEYPELSPSVSPLAIAKLLAAAIRGQDYDLVLTGAMSADDGYTAVGVALAEELAVPHAAIVRKVDVADGRARVVRELEGGIGEVVDLALPAVLTIQTGINKPRYAQILGIRAAQKKELKVQQLADIGLDAATIAHASGEIRLEKFYRPQVVSKAEFIEGDLDAKCDSLASKLLRAGGL